MPTARRIRRGAAGSSPPAPGSRSGSDQDFYDAVENSGDMAAEDVASVDKNEQAAVELARQNEVDMPVVNMIYKM